MNLLPRLAAVGVFVVLLSGCWPTPGAGPDRRSYNPFERTLTPDTVAGLTERFRAPLEHGAGAPVATPAGLFVKTGLSVAAFEPGTGRPRWTVRLPEDPEEYDDLLTTSDPHIVGNEVIGTWTAYGASGFLFSGLVTLRADTGMVERGPATPGSLQSVRGTAYATIEHELTKAGEFTTVGVDQLDGGDGWGGFTFEANGGVGTLGEDRLYVSVGGAVHAYDITTACVPLYESGSPLVCEPLWVRPVNGTATPVVIGDDDTIYTGAGNALYAHRAGTGGFRWRALVSSTVNRPPALDGTTLFVATTDGRLSALPAGGCGLVLCAPLWTTTGAAEPSAQPAVAGGVVYVGSADGTVRAFDAAGCDTPPCEPLWTVNAGAPVTGGLAVYNGRLYVGTSTGLVGYGLER